jgi:hypothetical protein
MRCTNLAHISPSVIDLTCFAASVGLLPTMLAIMSGSALGVPQVHDIDTCAPRITTMTTSSTAMAGRIRCTAHLIETTYETTTTGQKGDDVSNADELHNLLRALINDTLSKPRQPPRPYAASRKDARIRPLFTLGHDTSHFLYSHYCCCSGGSLSLTFAFSVHQYIVRHCFITSPRHGYCHSSHEFYSS